MNFIDELLMNTELAWQEQQAQLGATVPTPTDSSPVSMAPPASTKQPVSVSPTELQDEDSKPTKMTSRRPFGMIKGLRKPSNVMKPRPSLPNKLLPSALRRNIPTNSENSQLTESAFDVMAKYQTLTTQKKDEIPTGQLLGLDSPSSSVIGWF